MTGSVPSDVPLFSPEEEHSSCLDPASRKGVGGHSKASSCAPDDAWER